MATLTPASILQSFTATPKAPAAPAKTYGTYNTGPINAAATVHGGAQNTFQTVSTQNNTPASATVAPTVSAADTAAAAAASAKAAAEANQIGYLNSQVDQTRASGNQSGSVAGSTYNDQGSSLVSQIQQKQSAIDSARKSIAVDQINSIRGLSDSIQNGLKSGAVSLANSGALDSSANGAISRIYSNYGNTQRNVINNEAAVKNDSQDTAQTNLNLDRTIGTNSLNTYKNTVLDQISNDTQSKLAAIDGLAQTQGLAGRIDLSGVKDAIVKNAQDKLAEADKYIQGLLGNIGPQTQDAIAQKAYALTNAGVASSTGGLSYAPGGTAINPATSIGGADLTQIPLALAKKTGN